MKYTAVIASSGSPLRSIESNDIKEFVKLINTAGKVLYENGKRDLEVVFEDYPEEDLDKILSIHFSWEWI